MLSIETMTVRTVVPSTTQPKGVPEARYIDVAARCPACGGPRGTPKLRRMLVNDVWVRCHLWLNPCQHVDQYDALLAEAIAISAMRKSDQRTAGANP